MTTNASTLPVLVVGATGSLGGKVVDELLKRGKSVRALVRSTSDASRLENKGVEIARGDMLDVDSLVAAMNGVDAVITTAAGYTRGGKNAQDIDTIGNSNLAEAARRTGIRRFVLTSILTSDQTPNVPHFWHKKVAEDKLEQLGVPFAVSAGKPIKVRAVPPAVTRFVGAVAGPFKPIVQDMTAMFGWFDTGRYVANPRRQEQLFGPPPTAEDAIKRITSELVEANRLGAGQVWPTINE